jgi:hypothetical protein
MPKILITSFILLFLISIIFIPSTYAQHSSNIEQKNIVEQIIKLPSKKDKINKIKQESSKTRNKQFSEFLKNKVPVETINTLTQEKSNFKSKYETKKSNFYCWYNIGWATMKSYSGSTIFEYYLRIYACADYLKVYNARVENTWAGKTAFGISYHGGTGGRDFAFYTGRNLEWIASRQGLFKACVNYNWVCMYEYRPWVEYHATRYGYKDYSYAGY